jgi:prevent-host-death family protein
VKHVGIKQARQELPNLIDRAEAGEEIVITRQRKPVAKLTPAPKTEKPCGEALRLSWRFAPTARVDPRILRKIAQYPLYSTMASQPRAALGRCGVERKVGAAVGVLRRLVART